MARVTPTLIHFNRGVISSKAIARTDIERLASSSSQQENWMPHELGPMQFRAGTKYIDTAASNMTEAIYVPFVFSNDQTAIIELSGDGLSSKMRVLVDEEPVTRPAVTCALSDPEFGAGNSFWIEDSDFGASSSSFSLGTGSPTYLSLRGTKDLVARVYQSVTTTSPDVLHDLRVVVDKNFASAVLFVGTAQGSQDILERTELRPGSHSIAFTPGVSPFFVHFERQGEGFAALDYAQFISGGGATTLELDLTRLRMDFSQSPRSFRYTQSADVVFCTNPGGFDKSEVTFDQFSGNSYNSSGILDKIRQFQIERRDNNSWSVTRYSPDLGPFGLVNLTGTTVTPSAVSGVFITLTASQPLFKIGHLNSLMRIDSVGQLVQGSLQGEDQFSDPIRVTGVGQTRSISFALAGTWVATVTLQRSVGVTGNWEDVSTYTANNPNIPYNDGLDNTIVFYRLGIKTGDYTSGQVLFSLNYLAGSITGTARIYSVDPDGLTATAMVITQMGNITPSENWYFSQWSYEQGFPSAVELFEGRLWWCGFDRIWGSVSDNFVNYDYLVEGDSGPINRSIAYGPVETLRWLKGIQRLYAGGQTAEHSIKANSFDEPLTPQGFSLKQTSTVGSADVDAIRIDTSLMFAQRGGRRLYSLNISDNTVETQNEDLTLVTPEILNGRIKQMAVVRAPETRVHCVLEDGTIAVLVYNRIEDVRGWIPLRLASRYKAVSVFSLPSDNEQDTLYYQVRVEAPGDFDDGQYQLLKVARDDEAIGGQLNFVADSCVTYSGSAITDPLSTLGGHFPAGVTVSLWADGVAYPDVVTDELGGVPLAAAVPASNIVAGFSYEGTYRSVKLAYGASPGGTALSQRKRIKSLGLILENTHSSGIQYGPDFELMDDLPQSPDYDDIPEVYGQYDQDTFEFNGEWNTDSRLCLKARSPKPATVLAAIIVMQTNEKE